MDIQVHLQFNTLSPVPITYFRPEYLSSQNHNNLIVYESSYFTIPFEINDQLAISVPRSPFGSFYTQKDNPANEFKAFEQKVIEDLKSKNVETIEVRHPSSIYSSFVHPDILREKGFKKSFSDINQHIDLKQDWEPGIHQMQKRKLSSLRNEGFEFRVIPHSELEIAYKFLQVCRQAQGIALNISWDSMKTLVEKMPDRYTCFGVFREDKISALCLTVNVTATIAYYYLPATSPMFRSQSPMVLLLAGMVEYYQQNGYEFLDLGISSIQGKPQETLRLFKERMGAQETSKPTFTKSI